MFPHVVHSRCTRDGVGAKPREHQPVAITQERQLQQEKMEQHSSAVSEQPGNCAISRSTAWQALSQDLVKCSVMNHTLAAR
jgi:hypothetical protein